jgi:hypothetical protein
MVTRDFNHKWALYAHFDFFIEKNFWNICLQHVFFNICNSPITFMICVNIFWINPNCLKVYRFYQILHFILKNHHNFKSYKNMIIVLGFSFLYHKSQLCSYVIHIMTSVFFWWIFATRRQIKRVSESNNGIFEILKKCSPYLDQKNIKVIRFKQCVLIGH